ncbi:hypothetical protein GCM10010478_13340 [Streptomyces erythrogriseus]|uniref:Uncharacterized protein n=1 Tax=Streptomyces erythrogriseus TaxID=284027 RepID=A0ABN3WI86_9ACTN
MTHHSAEYGSDDIKVCWAMQEDFRDIPIDVTDDEDVAYRLGELVEEELPGAGEDAPTRLPRAAG